MNWLRDWGHRLRAELCGHGLAYMLLFLALLSGAGLGAAGPGRAQGEGLWGQSGAELGAYLVDYLSLLPYAQTDAAAELRDFLLWNGLPLAVLLLSGLYMLGLPLVLAVIFLRSFTFGFTDAYLLSCGGAPLCLALLPPQCLLLLLYVRAGRQALSLSRRLWRREGLAGNGRGQFLAYLRFCGLCLVPLLLAGLLQVYLPLLLLGPGVN